jgi:hypothetical protein
MRAVCDWRTVRRVNRSKTNKSSGSDWECCGVKWDRAACKGLDPRPDPCRLTIMSIPAGDHDLQRAPYRQPRRGSSLSGHSG